MGKKAFVARTQVIQSRFSIRCLEEAVLRTLPIAHSPDLTFQAVAGQSLYFGFTERPLHRTLEKLDQRSLRYISKAMLDVDEVVTRIEVSVVFDNGNVAAGRPEDAQ